METEKVANLLLSLSSTHATAIDEAIRRRKKTARGAAADNGAFVCKTCSREFDSFQALGGHSTSHSRARSLDPAAMRKTTTTTTQKHECSICGLGFSMGQALGGHMRRHRAAMEAAEAAAAAAAAAGAGRGEEVFDLNQLPALEDEEENASEICGGGNGRGSQRRLLELFI